MKKIYVYNSRFVNQNKYYKTISTLINSKLLVIAPGLLEYNRDIPHINRGNLLVYKLELIHICDYIFIFDKRDLSELVLKSGLRDNLPVFTEDNIYDLIEFENIPDNKKSENRKRSEKHD